MAEFAEVMREARRMCKVHTDCKGCPRVGLRCVTVSCIWGDEDIADFERTVHDWAKAHPEPRYPTWWDWFFAERIEPVNPIPADIAEKLGIEPKEG